MNYLQLSYIHMFTVVPAFFIGTWLLFRRKGTAQHKFLGKIYMLLMVFTASVSLFMPAQIGQTLFGHFGPIHLLSVLVLYSVPMAIYNARTGNIRGHKRNMLALYFGGMIVAGTFAAMPGRLLHQWLFG